MARTYTAAAVYHSPYSPKCLLMPSCLNLMRPAAAAGFDMESAAGSVHVETVRERERERGREEELQRIPDVRSTIVSNKIRTCAQCTIQRGFRHLHSFSSSDLSLSLSLCYFRSPAAPPAACTRAIVRGANVLPTDQQTDDRPNRWTKPSFRGVFGLPDH